MEARNDIALAYSDAQNGVGDDVERTIRHYARSGIVRVMNCAVEAKNALSKSGQNQTGGISLRVEREERIGLQEAIVRKLQKDFPGLIELDRQRPNRCKFVGAPNGQT